LSLGLLYFLFVFFACIGTIQLSADYRGLKYILFFQNRLHTKILSFVSLLPALSAFFFWNDYLPVAIIQGLQQAYLFALALVAALLLTFFTTSIIYRKPILVGNPHKANGFDVFRLMPYTKAIKNRK
jgi:hypothetical protein